MPITSRRTFADRKVHRRSPIPTFLIVCEGERTEPDYFRQFRVAKNVRGEAMNTLSLVRRTIEIREEAGPFDHVWIVFDLDSFPHQDFDHTFVNDYYNGITKTEAERRIKEMLKTISERDNKIT